MKKVWEKPVLIVLVRSKPEEAILNGCKGQGADGANSNYEFCLVGNPSCVECAGWGSS